MHTVTGPGIRSPVEVAAGGTGPVPDLRCLYGGCRRHWKWAVLDAREGRRLGVALGFMFEEVTGTLLKVLECRGECAIGLLGKRPLLLFPFC